MSEIIRMGDPMTAAERANMIASAEAKGSEVFLIEKLWTDSTENHPLASSGYKPIGVFMGTEDQAKVMVADAGIMKGEGHPLYEDTPNLRYKKLPLL